MNGTSGVYIEQMYESWLHDKSTVHKSWDAFFSNVVAGAEPGQAFQVHYPFRTEENPQMVSATSHGLSSSATRPACNYGAQGFDPSAAHNSHPSDPVRRGHSRHQRPFEGSAAHPELPGLSIGKYPGSIRSFFSRLVGTTSPTSIPWGSTAPIWTIRYPESWKWSSMGSRSRIWTANFCYRQPHSLLATK